MATVDAMRVANKEIKKQYKGLDIDKIESIHYDMEDLIEQANEIQESLGRSYGVPDEVDEADLQAGELIGSVREGDYGGARLLTGRTGRIGPRRRTRG